MPKDAQYIYQHLYYKKGVHDYVFVWLNDAWVKSTQYWSDVVKGKPAR